MRFHSKNRFSLKMECGGKFIWVFATLSAINRLQTAAQLLTPINWENDDSGLINLLSGVEQCQNQGDKFVNPEDCTSYHVCTIINGVWQLVPKDCSPGHAAFDDDPEVKECVDLFGFCPNEPAPYPPISKCTRHDELHVDPSDCGTYFRCHLYRNGNYYPEFMQCPTNQKFDDYLKECVDGECPQDLTPLPTGPGWHCSQNGEMNVDPTDCSKAYICHQCGHSPNGWCYTTVGCSPGWNFDDNLKTCVKGPCPQDVTELPGGPGWHCDSDGDKNQYPGDCTQYYTCIMCSKPRGWCYEAFSCPSGQFFDEDIEDCVTADVCPQEMIPLPPGWACGSPGSGIPHVNPEHCNQYYNCYKCNKGSTGFCYVGLTCPGGQNFDDKIKMCVDGLCPQNLLPLEPEMQCSMQGEKNQYPWNCRQYYECHTCSEPGGFCYILHTCPSGQWFDEATENCVMLDYCPQTPPAPPPPPPPPPPIISPPPSPPPSPPIPPPKFKCRWNGYYVYEGDCRKYWFCECAGPYCWGKHVGMCPPDKRFDPSIRLCSGLYTCDQ